MKRWLAVALAAFCVVGLWGVSGCGRHEARIDVDGVKRTYRLHTPAAHDPAAEGALPLVIALHQFTDTGRGMERLTGFNALADRDRFLVAYPNGLRRGWRQEGEGGAADVAFLLAMIDAIDAAHPVDRARIYATGASAGGMMAQYMACVTDAFAAIAPVMGSVTESALVDCPPIPVMTVHGTEDSIVPFDGGETFAGPGRRPVFFSAEGQAAFWAATNGCGETPEITPAPGTDGVVERWAYPCADAPPVVFYKVVGGGHTWPGGRNRYPGCIVGPTVSTWDATGAIWEFFQGRARNSASPALG